MNKKRIGIVAAVILVVLAVALVVLLQDRSPSNTATKESTLSTTESDGQTESQPPETTSMKETEEVVLPETQPVTDPTQATTEPESQPAVTQTPEATHEPEPPEEMSFPYSIPGTSLVIMKIDSYDGIFLEDGTDREITGISTMVLVNVGTTDVEYANIMLQQQGRTLQFKATVLPAGATVVVQESGASEYRNDPCYSCTADVAEVQKLEMSSAMVKVTDNGNGTLMVTNLTDNVIPCVRVFYKFCMVKGSIYVGGITYTSKVDNLAAGESQILIPSHYDSEASEIVMIRTYDES